MTAHDGGLRFQVIDRDGGTGARSGRLETPRGAVRTPAFMPVGTQAAVRALTPEQLEAAGTRILVANTFHLHLRPGEEVVKAAGGLHRFMAWDGLILTDSGGFQVHSLASWNRIDDGGVTFRSPIDGADIRLTPEKAIAIQNDLGADIIMAFDQCPAYPADREEIAKAVERTADWAGRCREAHRRTDQALFGIIQGGVHLDLRQRSLEGLARLDFPGYAIGGVAVGEPREEIHRVIAAVGPALPADRPRYLMGLGTPEDLLAGIAAGIDLFDCVLATRNARNATLFTRAGLIRLRNQAYEKDFTPLDPDCSCYACRRFTRSYLRHLHARRQSLAGTLGSIHNLRFFHDLMAAAGAAIGRGEFGAFRAGYPGTFRAAAARADAGGP